MINVRERVQQAPPPTAEAPPASARTTQRRIRSRPLSRDTWLDRVIAEAGLVAVATVFWGVNAWFTVQGGVALGLPLWGGLLLHITISKSETYLWHRWRQPAYLLALVVAVLIDVGTTLIGIVAVVAERLPWLLGGAPTNVQNWIALLETPIPPWWGHALGLLGGATLVALAPERLLKHFWRGLRETWDEYER